MIDSVKNEKIKNYSKLLLKKYRDDTGLFIAEGYNLVNEAKKAGIVVEVFSVEPDEGTHVSLRMIGKLSSTKTPQDIVAVCRKKEEKPIGNKVLFLNEIQDPGNVGTLIRTSRAFGWDTVIVQGVDVYNPKVVRSTQGAFFNMNVINSHEPLALIKDHFKVGAMLDKEAITYDDFKNTHEKMALILGNESKGIRPDVIEKLDAKVYIPIDFESLNVAQAGAILLNEYK